MMWAMSSGCGNGSAVPGWSVDRGIVEVDDGELARVEPLGQFAGRQRRHGCGIGNHELQPRRGHARIDRQIRRPGLQAPPRSPRSPQPTAATTTPRTRPGRHPVADQQVRQAIRGLVELAIGQRPIPTAQRARIRDPLHLLSPQLRDRHRRSRLATSTARLPISSSPACSPPSSRSIEDSRRDGSATIAASTCSSRRARSATSKFDNGPPAPAVLKNRSSPSLEKIRPNPPTWPELVYDAEAFTPPNGNVNPAGMKFKFTR